MSKESIDRIGVLSSLSHHCAARIDSLSVHLSDSDIQHVDSFIQGCEDLDHGEIDLFVAPSKFGMIEKFSQTKDCLS